MVLKRVWKLLFTLLIAAVTFASAAVLAGAVPAPPGANVSGAAGQCRSHHGELVTLDTVAARQSGAAFAPSIEPITQKSIPLLMITVGFENMPYMDEADWHEWIFQGEKSVSAYFSDMSFGQFTFAPAPETSAFGTGGNTNVFDAVNDGVVHVTLASEHKDWAGEDEYPAMAAALSDAIAAADAYVDYAAFDANGDGKIATNEMALGFVIAGYEGATGDVSLGAEKYFWSHAWTFGEIIRDYELEDSIPMADGVEVNSYIGIAEQLFEEEREPISVLAHELGHYLGLPDLYDTSNVFAGEWRYYDVGDLSLMANGNWGADPDGGFIPYSMDVWSRFALGWCTPETVNGAGEYAVAAQSYTQDDAFHALYIPTQRAGEYYLLENRQFTKWDAGMADDYESGILVWHIDDAVFETYNPDNAVNNHFHRPGVMPLYAEYEGDGYTLIGKTRVNKYDSVYSAEAWQTLFGDTPALDLPLYGEGDDADKRASRTLSGIKLTFTDNTGPEMHVAFSDADHVHFLTAVDAAAPGCTEPGNIAHWECGYCGGAFADEAGTEALPAEAVTISPAGHTFGTWAITVQPGCVTAGEQTRTCGACGAKETLPVEATGHAYGAWTVTVQPGCTTAGEQTRTCAVCGSKETLPVGATGHAYGAWAVTANPGCTTAGEQTRVCAGCGNKETAPLAALGHTEPNVDGCCARCGERLVQQEQEQEEDLCNYCGKDHGSSFFGKLTRFFHNILWFFKNLFTR